MPKYNGLATNMEAMRIYNYCARTQPNNILGCCLGQVATPGPTPIPIPDPGKMKTVFLLELTAGLVQPTDIAIKNTLNYYWNTYPREFIECPIVDTKGSLSITLQLLEEYYNYGFRYFVGFTSSNICIGVVPWFNLHSDATGFTNFGNANFVSIPKNIYRLKPTNNYRIDSITEQIDNAIDNGGNIYYVYQDGLLVCNELLSKLSTIVPSQQFFSYPATNNNLTVNEINNFFSNNISDNSISIIYLTSSSSTYINLYASNILFNGQQYDINGNQPPTIPSGTISDKFNGKYNVLNFNGINSSILWRNGYIALGQTNYDITSLNILNLLNQFLNNDSVDNINSHYGILEFDPVNKDTLFPNILLQQYNGTDFVNTSLYVVDPILGPYYAIFTNPASELSLITTPSYKPYGKAIALFELTNYISYQDNIFKESIYYFWYKDSSLPRFPIVDTETSTSKTLELLNLYYSQGYRIFLGMSSSGVVNDVRTWFDDRPDAVGISIWSTAPSLRIPKNIYRLTPSENYALDAVLPKLSGKTVYYFYTISEFASYALLTILEKLDQDGVITLKTYGVEDDSSNLTVDLLEDFFSGATADDYVTLLYILDDQPYFDLYIGPDGLTFPGLQYDIINGQIPKINGDGRTELNNKLYFLQNYYPSSSLLWRENTDYLTKKYNTITDSKGTINALKMIDNFQKGKNIGLLASYLAVLEFDSITKDIKYPSYLFRLYNEITNTFEKNLLYFDDPLLGSFYADFV